MTLRTRVGVLSLLVLALAGAVSVKNGAATFAGSGALLAQDLVYQCPMDADVRSNQPGKCPRCGMELRAGIPEPMEFPMDFSVAPQPVKPGVKEKLNFTIRDPQNAKVVEHFQLVHERLFHAFIIGADLSPETFIHDHPVWMEKEHKFVYEYTFPKPGLYRVLGDFFPDGATPQLNAKTVVVPGGTMTLPKLGKDYSLKTMANMNVSLTTEPPQPIAGTETRIFLHIEKSEGMELYLGAWAHMLAASDDLIDLIHSHPYQADGGPEMQFRTYFPRGHVYRVWYQFQKQGVVNTAYFDIPVKEL